MNVTAMKTCEMENNKSSGQIISIL